MKPYLSPIISPTELLALYGSEELIIIDASARATSRERYLNEHLEGAFHLDLETEIANIEPDVSVGGRHPLPSPENFTATINKLGIKPESHIIIYDEDNAANAAARLWWMFAAIGHKKVQVVDGGYQAAVKAGFPLSNLVAQSPPTANESASPIERYTFESWQLPLADINEIDEAILDENYLIVDVRDAYRYNGESEPIDLIAGHIPSAVNIPYSQNLDSEGFYLTPQILKEKYEKAFAGYDVRKIALHCGSGVTACHTALAIAYAGLEMPKIYMGSWGEWSRNNRPMVLR